MHLLIRAVSLAGQPLTQAISAYFDERGGTIGRSDTNTLALPDPERRISRLQAEVSLSAEGWRILNVGNANPIWHNNRPVPPGEGVQLGEGDELQIGTYALRVNQSQNDETARTITKGRATIDSRTVIAGSGTEPKTDSGRMAAEGRVSIGVPTPTPTPTPIPAVVSGEPLTLPSIAMPRVAAQPSVPAAAAPASPFADLLGDLSSGSASSTPPGAGPAPSSASPFADILGFGGPSAAPAASFASSTPSAASPAAPSPWASSASASPFAAVAAPAASPSPAGVNRLPDDFDPFADLAPKSPTGRPAVPAGSWDLPQAAPAPASASPFDIPSPAASPLPGDLDLLGSVQPAGGQSIDQLFGLGGGKAAASTSHDPLADFLRKTEPSAPAEAPVGAPVSIDPLALLSSRENIADARPPAPAAAPTLPDDVPELNAAMPLPAVETRSQPLPSSGAREPMSASFTFMSPRAGAQAGGSSQSAGAGLLDDLDLRPQPVPASPATDTAQTEADDDDTRPGELDMALSLPAGGAARLSAPPIETQVAPEHGAAGKPAMPDFADLEAGLELVVPRDPHAAAQAQPGVQLGVPPEGLASAAPSPVVAAHEAGVALPAGDALPADTAALWAAFCEGAGVKFLPPQGLNPDLMRVIGQLLRHAVDGSLKLVAARAATKTELRAEVTVIQARRNNPLKFSPDTQSAMEQLLQPPLRGFMSGPEAVADAMDDLLGHTIGTMVGMRAALEGVLSRFEPSQLEAKLAGHSMLDSVLPMNRRAKLWELYLQHYETVRTEAQDDFHNLFGRAFLQAYEEQLDRLDAERRQAGRASGTAA